MLTIPTAAKVLMVSRKIGLETSNRYRSRQSVKELLDGLTVETAAYAATAKAYEGVNVGKYADSLFLALDSLCDDLRDALNKTTAKDWPTT
jgi:hypothetical protein